MELVLYISLFISTNIDDLVLLHVRFSHFKSISTTKVFLGQFCGILISVLLSFIIANFGVTILGSYISYSYLLGIFPIYMGLQGLKKNHHSLPETTPQDTHLLNIIATTIANGSDNIAVYIPIMIGISYGDLGLIIVVFFIMTGVWIYIAKQSSKIKLLEKFAPYLLIIIGIYIIIG